MANATSKPPRTFVCATCGSSNVLRDAWAAWDDETQRWELHATFDHAFCEECDGETWLECKPLKDAEREPAKA